MLQAHWDGTFSASSYGFRPGRSAHQAVAAAQALIASGRCVVVDLDIEKFFDRVNHDILMGLVAKRVADKRILKLIRGFLTCGVLADGLVGPTDEGTPQGGPLSPLLSNLMLDVLDKELERRGHCFARYADDCNIYVCSQRAGERVMASVERFLERRLKLKINRAKSAVAPPSERKFLGFSFTRGATPRRRIAPQAIARFKDRVRKTTRRTRGASLEKIVEGLSRYLVGWRGYFGFCETPSVLRALDQWIRRRLRSIVVEAMETRANPLSRSCVAEAWGIDLAAQTAGSAHGPWRISNSPALAIALPNDVFRKTLRLASLAANRIKPFDIRELAARVEALLRRGGDNRVTRLQAGELDMDLVERKVRRAGKPVDLLPREFKLLEYFMRRPGQIVTRAMLLEDVWNFKFVAQTNVVDVQISNLRRKLDSTGARRLIVNVRAVGFKLNADD